MALPGFFAKWLREKRTLRGLGFRELGRLSGVSPTTISYIEDGTRIASAKMVVKLADGLELSRIVAMEQWKRDKNELIGDEDSSADPDETLRPPWEGYENESPDLLRRANSAAAVAFKNAMEQLKDLEEEARKGVIGGRRADNEEAGRGQDDGD